MESDNVRPLKQRKPTPEEIERFYAERLGRAVVEASQEFVRTYGFDPDSRIMMRAVASYLYHFLGNSLELEPPS